LIVQIDETLDPNSETPATEADAKALLERAKALLVPAETGSEFQKNYFLALQQSPDVVLLHSEVIRLLR
jgi:chemotaxis response regulator CheB